MTADQINYMIHPTKVDRIDNRGEWRFDDADLYDELILAGYPASDDPETVE